MDLTVTGAVEKLPFLFFNLNKIVYIYKKHFYEFYIVLELPKESKIQNYSEKSSF